MSTKQSSSSQKPFPSLSSGDRFPYQRIYENLRQGFDEPAARVMNETLIEFADYQDNKFAESMSRVVVGLTNHMDQRFDFMNQRFQHVDSRFEEMDRRFEEIDRKFDAIDKKLDAMVTNEKFDRVIAQTATKEDFSRLATDLHRELHLLTWRFIKAGIACCSLTIGAMYFLLQYTK